MYVRSRRVAEALRRIREESGLSGETVAGRLKWSPSKISRAELFRTGLPLGELERLIAFYRQRGRTDENRLDRLLGYARGVASDRAALLPPAAPGDTDDLEEAAEVLEWAAVTVPDFLRTPGYARAVLLSTEASTRVLPSAVARAAATAREWQERLSAGTGTRMQVVLDEAVLHRQFGGPGVLREQLEYLLALPAPDVELRVLPLAGGGPGAVESFRHVRYAEVDEFPLSDAVMMKRLEGEDRVDEESEAYTYRLAFLQLWQAAAAQAETAKLVRAAIRKTDQRR